MSVHIILRYTLYIFMSKPLKQSIACTNYMLSKGRSFYSAFMSSGMINLTSEEYNPYKNPKTNPTNVC